MQFDLHIGIDYSGAATSVSRLAGLRVYACASAGTPRRVTPPASARHWTRREVAGWLIEQARAGRRFIAGIDHGFSMPIDYFRRYKLRTWDEFLADFVTHWPTHHPNTTVQAIRRRRPPRTGRSSALRLTETWTGGARSVFHFDAQGQVATSTHAGLPWLHHLRRELGPRLHVWPFDGWDLPVDRCVLVEVFPSMLRRRYARARRTVDEHDAYAIARWLRELDADGRLRHYAHPPLRESQRRIAQREGWIFGVA